MQRGRGRKLQSTEMVMAVINDPTRIDPLAAMVYKRLSDARRLMQKNKERLRFAIHTFELMKARDDNRDLYKGKKDLWLEWHKRPLS